MAYRKAGARRPLPLSPLLLLTPLSSRPYFRAHFATEFSEGSRWHLALLSSHSEDRRQRSSADRPKNKKNDLKMRIEDILPSTSCLELAVLPVPTGMLLLFLLLLLLLLMLISIPVLHLGGCCRFSKKKKERLRCKPASNLGTFMAFGAIDGTLVRLICPHTCKNTHTHIHKHAQTCCRVFLSELPATSSACCLERTGNTTGSTRDLLIHTHRHTADLIRTCTHRSFEAAGKWIIN